jgi:Putative transcriptional regulator
MLNGNLGFYGVDFDAKEVKSGSILISEPLLLDSNFSRSVVLITEHSPLGAFGLVLNKPLKKRISDVIDGFGSVNFPLYSGGPVDKDTLHFIHSLGDRVQGSIKVGENLYWGGNFEDLQEMAKLGILSAGQVRFFIGYSGWMANQLENELKEKSWVVSNISSTEIFFTQPDDLWEQSVRMLGQKFNIWLNYPADPIYN